MGNHPDVDLLLPLLNRAFTSGQTACELWGDKAQVLMMVEEASELSVACLHSIRARAGSAEEVTEELADVLIVAMQLYKLAGPTVLRCMQEKIARLDERIATAQAGLRPAIRSWVVTESPRGPCRCRCPHAFHTGEEGACQGSHDRGSGWTACQCDGYFPATEEP